MNYLLLAVDVSNEADIFEIKRVLEALSTVNCVDIINPNDTNLEKEIMKFNKKIKDNLDTYITKVKHWDRIYETSISKINYTNDK